MSQSPEAIKPLEVFMPKSAAAVALFRLRKGGGIQTLLAPRLEGPEAGQYTLPGGKIETGETPTQAAARELKEETSLTIGPNRLKRLRPISSRVEVGKRQESIQLHLFAIGLPACNGTVTQGLDSNLGIWKWLSFPQITRLNEEGKLTPVVTTAINRFLTPPACFLEDCLLISLGLPVD